MDMPVLDAMEARLAEYVGPLLVISHDRYFLDRIEINRVAVLRDGQLRLLDNVAEYEREWTGGDLP